MFYYGSLFSFCVLFVLFLCFLCTLFKILIELLITALLYFELACTHKWQDFCCLKQKQMKKKTVARNKLNQSGLPRFWGRYSTILMYIIIFINPYYNLLKNNLISFNFLGPWLWRRKEKETKHMLEKITTKQLAFTQRQ